MDLGLAILTLVVLVIFGGVLIFSVLGAVGFWVYLLILFGPFLEQRTSHVRKNLKLKGDFEASKLVGTGPFLSVLEKIDALEMKDMERTKKRKLSRYFSSKPSITERIQNLNALRFDQAGVINVES